MAQETATARVHPQPGPHAAPVPVHTSLPAPESSVVAAAALAPAEALAAAAPAPTPPALAPSPPPPLPMPLSAGVPAGQSALPHIPAPVPTAVAPAAGALANVAPPTTLPAASSDIRGVGGIVPVAHPPPAAVTVPTVPPVKKSPTAGGGGGAADLAQHPSCFLPLEEFAEDIELNLGRANGNIFHRREGIEGVHDGQIMVRLKKKRFIVIDYGILPTAVDIAAASVNPHVACPAGAGKQKCVTADCPKRGVPVLLYDSDPSEPASLYLRSGLCFTCQRILNEKRRTQRKRKSDAVVPPPASDDPRHNHHDMAALDGGGAHPHGDPNHGHGAGAGGGDGFHHMDPASAAKRFRLNGDIVDLSPDAIIINGPLDGTRHHGPGYGFAEIGADLTSIVAEAARATERLVGGVNIDAAVAPLSQPLHSRFPGSGAPTPAEAQSDNAVAVAAAAAAAAAAATVGDSTLVDAATAAAVEATAPQPPVEVKQERPVTGAVPASRGAPVPPQVPLPPLPPPPTTEEIPALYERAFLSLSRAIYLLSQWKASRDTHDAEESARKAALEVPHIPLSSVSDHGGALAGLVSVNADAVAAAAAAAVASAGVAPPPLPPQQQLHVVPEAVEAAAPAVVAAAHPPPPPPPPAPMMSTPAPGVAVPPLVAPAAPVMSTTMTAAEAAPPPSQHFAMEIPAASMNPVKAEASAMAVAKAPSRPLQNVAAVLATPPANGAVSDGSPSGMIPLLLAAEGRKNGAAVPKVKEEVMNAVAARQAHPQQEQIQGIAGAADPPGTAHV